MPKEEKILLEFSPKEFSIVWDAVNNKVLNIYAQTRKKDIEKWRKENLKNELKEIQTLQNFFGEVAKNFTIKVKR